MARERSGINKGLPTGWRWRGKSICYMVPKGCEAAWDGKKEFRLGTTLREAHKTFLDRTSETKDGEIVNFAQLCDRFLTDHVSTLAFKTQESYRIAVTRIRLSLGSVAVADMDQSMAREMHKALVKNTTLSVAKSTIGTLKTMMTKAAEYKECPTCKYNPLLGMRFESAGTRNRYVEDWEVQEMLSLEPTFRGVRLLQPYIQIKLMTGLRRSDLLRMTLADIREDGIHCQPHKTLKTSMVRLHFSWNDDLRKAVGQVLLIPPRRIGNSTLFTTREGKTYINDDGLVWGFDSIWRRFVDKCLAETKITERFQEKDLRAKAASDAINTAAAQLLLGHSSPAVTEKHYRRKETIIETPTLGGLGFAGKR